MVASYKEISGAIVFLRYVNRRDKRYNESQVRYVYRRIATNHFGNGSVDNDLPFIQAVDDFEGGIIIL